MKTKFTLLSVTFFALLQVFGLQQAQAQAPVTITYAGSPYKFTQGMAITSITPVVTGTGPFKYKINPALPGGLTLDSTTGVISGNPAAVAPSVTYTVTCTAASNSATATLSIVVVAAPPVVSYPGSPYAIRIRTYANIIPTVSGTAPIRFTIFPYLPSGLNFNTSTGAITGSSYMPMEKSVYTVSANNSGGTVNASLQIIIGDFPTVYYSRSSYTFIKGEAITTLVPTVDGGGPYSYSISPSLPAGFSINTATGVISGTPAGVSVNTAYTVTCTNPFGNRATALNIAVQAPPPPNDFSYTTPKLFLRGSAILPQGPVKTFNAPVALAYGVGGAYGVAADMDGNVYVAQLEYNTVSKISKDGYNVTTVGSFAGPTGVAYDAYGNLYVVEHSTGDIVKIAPDGSRATYGGLDDAIDMAVDGQGNMYVAEREPLRLTKIAPDGTKTTIGQGISKPCGVDIDSSGNVYVGEYGGTVKKISKAGQTTVIGTGDGGSSVAVDRMGNVFIGGTSLLKISPDGSQVSLGAINYAYGLATNADGSVYAADHANSAVFVVSSGPKVQSYKISPGLPAGLAFDTLTGIMSGTPIVVSAQATYTVTATNSGGSTSTTLQLEVGGPPSISYAGSPYQFTVGTAITVVTPLAGGTLPITYRISPVLPAGLVLDTSSGAIAGTPATASAQASYTVTATSVYGNDTANLAITVAPAPAITVTGQQGFTKYAAYFPSSFIDSANNVYATYMDSNTTRGFLAKYDGDKWVRNDSSFSSSTVVWPTMARGPKDTVFVAYLDYSLTNMGKIVVKKLAGTNWVQVGPAVAVTQYYQNMRFSFAVAPDGTPYLAFVDAVTTSNGLTTSRLKVCKLVNSVWITITAGAGTIIYQNDRTLTFFAFTVAPNGKPYLAYTDPTTLKFLVSTYDNGWKAVGDGNPLGSFAGLTPAITVAAAGTPYVAWTAPYTQTSLCAKFVNGAWVAAGPATGINIKGLSWSIAMNNAGAPVVAVIDTTSRPTIFRLSNNNTWVTLGKVPPTHMYALALSNSGTPYIVYRDTTAGNKLSLARYDSVPIVNNIIIHTNSLCGKVDSILAMAPLGGTTPYTYAWQSSTDNVNFTTIAGQTAATFKASPALSITTTTYFRRVVNPGFNSSVSNVVAYFSNKGSVTIKADTTSICAGTAVTLTATATNAGDNPFYQWQKDGVNVGANSSVYVDNDIKNKSIIKCKISSSACMVTTMPVSNTLRFAVLGYSTTSLAIAETPDTNRICSGVKVTFKSTVTNGGSAPTYQWFKNSTVVGTSPNYFDATIANGDSIWCIVTSNAKCLVTPTGKSKVFKFKVTQSLAPAISISINTNTRICFGTPVTFKATATDTTTKHKYQWVKNNLPVGTNTATYIDNSLKNSDSVWCVLSVAAPCVADSVVESNMYHFKVDSLVTVSVTTALVTPLPICAGTNVRFKATAVNAGPAPVYQWYKNGIAVTGITNTYVDSLLASTDSVWCVVTGNAGCMVSDEAKSNAVITPINPKLTATLNVTTNPGTAVCEGVPVTFKAVVANTGANPKFQWYKNRVSVGTNDSIYAAGALQNKDTIACTLTATAACVTPVSQTIKIKMSVTAIPAAPAITGPIFVAANSSQTYSVPTIPGVNTYNWAVPAGATIVTGAGTRTIKVNWGSTGGTVSVKLSTDCGLSQPGKLTVSIASSLTNNSTASSSTRAGSSAGVAMKVYPNPAASSVKINFTATRMGRYVVQVVNINGKILQSVQGATVTGNNNIILNVSTLAQGTYFIRLMDGEHATRVTKLMKQNNAVE